MTDSDLARYGKKFVNLFWDPIPRNTEYGIPIHCLGLQYENNPPSSSSTTDSTQDASQDASQESEVLVDPVTSPSESNTESTAESNASRSYDAASEPEEITKSQVDEEQQKQQKQLEQQQLEQQDDGGWPAAFLDDFESRIWMTYRSNFPGIPRSQDPKATAAMSLAVRFRNLGNQDGFMADTGWGCMIRSGQSLLANALLLAEFGRDWRRGQRPLDERKLLSLFADDPKAPFSIHSFVQHGATACGKYPGEWFGPSATARCIQALTNNHGSNLVVYITGDGSEVVEDEVFAVARAKTGKFQPTLILVGTRLGLDRITPVYWEALKSALHLPQSVGIAGGRPSSSHYFVGTQGQSFFYLDPHHTRPALPLHADPADLSDEDVSSCHTRRVRRLDIREMDPSMLLGFLVRDELDWRRWKASVTAVQGKPIIHVLDQDWKHPTFKAERASAIDEVETLDTEDEF